MGSGAREAPPSRSAGRLGLERRRARRTAASPGRRPPAPGGDSADTARRPSPLCSGSGPPQPAAFQKTPLKTAIYTGPTPIPVSYLVYFTALCILQPSLPQLKKEGLNARLAVAAVADAGQAIFAELDALVAGVHMGEEVLGAGELPRGALLAGAEGADPEAGAHVAVLPQQAQPML